MCHQSIIDVTCATKRRRSAPEIHKIHKPESLSAPTGATPESHSTLISKWFGIQSSSSPHFPTAPLPHLPNPTPGQIILITGPSGSGKSSLLRRFRRRLTIPIINIPRILLTRRPVIDHFPHISIESALSHLSRVGLAEAHCYLLPPRHLSDGQRWRLRLALALSLADTNSRRVCFSTPPSLHCLLSDEFTTLLDPVTACVVARVLRRAITPESNLCAGLACSRTDILRALAPDLIIRCDFGNLQFWKKTKGESYEQQEGALQRVCAIANRDSTELVEVKSPIANPNELHSRPPHPRRRHPRRL